MTTPVLQNIADAPRVEGMGGAISVRLRSEETGDRLALIEMVIPAGFAGTPLHVHPSFDEAFYVLEGELTYRVGAELITAGPGALVYVPGSVPHTFAELTGSVGARVLLWVTPAGHERYFDDLTALMLASPDGPPAVEALGSVMREHGIEIVGGPDPREVPAGVI
jgi:quercetin dioxygenase-like cupin family protein